MNCGEEFCERCGDCLYCYGDDHCYNEGDYPGDHQWPQREVEEESTEETDDQQ